MSANKITELREGVEYVEAELAAIHTAAEGRALNEDEQTRWDEGKTFVTEQRKVIADLEARDAFVQTVQRGGGDKGDQNLRDKSFGFHRDHADDAENLYRDRMATPQQLSDGILRSLERNDTDDTQVRTVLRRHLTGTGSGSHEAREWARELVLRSTPVYTDAFFKGLVGRSNVWSNEERAAISATTAANGGYLVPTHLDPTIILTNDGSANALRPISRVVTTIGNSNVWYGVSSAGVTASADAPLTEVSDDSPTFAQPSVPVHKAQAFVQATVEALDDIGSLASDIMMMFADAKDVLEGGLHCTGTGTNQATGIFTAIDASGNETVSTTAATIGLVDLQAVRRAVGQRWRRRSTWVMNPEWADAIKNLGIALSASYSTDITQANTDTLLGRPVVETDDAPAVTTTTALDDRLVFGDFQNYVIVDKPGSMSVNFIPPGILQNTSNNLPDGRVGWYTYWRTGADSVNDAAFQMLMDKTSV